MNKNIELYLMAIFLFFGGVLFSQQERQFSLYSFNPLAVNPAYAGSNDAFVGTLIHRSQWVTFDGAPTTQTLTMHTPFKKQNIGVGLSLFNDRIGAWKNQGFSIDGSYKLRLDKDNKHFLSAGLKLGLRRYSVDYKSAVNAFDETELSYITGVVGKMTFNPGFGLYYHTENHYVGLSSPFLLKNELYKSVDGASLTEVPHFYLAAGKVFKINSIWKLLPQTLIKYEVNSPLIFDLNINAIFNDKLSFGIMYRLKDAIGLNLIYYLNDKIKMGYAYDLGSSQFSSFHGGSHEIMLSYDLFTRNKSIINPRYF